MALYRFKTSKQWHGHGGTHYLKCPKCGEEDFKKNFLLGFVCKNCGRLLRKKEQYGEITRWD